jgi:uncharacterized protein YyaL (SSP411 family)
MHRLPLSRVLLFMLLLACLAQPALAANLQNSLRGHASPYLALHGQDPVAWQEWNAETVARARRENKLLFVSLGYFSCHWCHVMQQESYRDPAIAALLNRHFIPVKVDRELNAALDATLIEFASRLNGVAGWPLNAFVTPDGYPVYAVLYQPPVEFKRLLNTLAADWRTQADALKQAARDAVPAPSPPSRIPSRKPDAETVRQLQQAYLAAVWQRADSLQGGFSQVSKFPMPSHLAQLLEIHARQRDPHLAEFLQLTLDQMARRGLDDHVNGGFFRYTVDPDWQTPHFEKMLYDNAQLAPIYARAAEVFKRPDYLALAHQTLDFMLDTLGSPEGGFYTATSALDRRGREGGAYLWQAAALRRLVKPAEFDLLSKVWGLDAPAPFALGYLPQEKGDLSPAERARLQTLLQPILVRLKAVGRNREAPLDSKINAGLNGLALSAFSRAGQGVPRFEAAARKLRGYLESSLIKQGQLAKTRAGKRLFPDAELDDYAYVVAGLDDYARVYRDPSAGKLAKGLAQRAWSRFFSAGGWQREVKPLLATLRPQSALPDGALPSAASRLMSATQSLLQTQPDAALSAALDQALALALPAIQRNPFDYPGGLGGLVGIRPR